MILDQIRQTFVRDGEARNAGGLHLSDLLSPRKAFWARAMPLPPDDKDILYFVAGRGHEDAIGRVSGLVVTEQKVWQASTESPPVSYRPDFTLNDLFPGEFKTRRANLAPSGEEAIVYESYLEQLRGYCAIQHEKYGVLIVLSLLEGRKAGEPKAPTEPALAVYDVFFTDEELAATRAWLEERRDELVSALRIGDPSPLPLCKAWMCGKPRKVQERGPFCLTCNKEFQTDYTARRHKHEVQPAAVHWEYEPRCKWWKFCKPYSVDPERGPRES